MAVNLKRKRNEGDNARKVNDEDVSPGQWSGILDASAPEASTSQEASTKPKKPPTSQELRMIKNADDLHHSSLFKLQIDALLPNVRPKYASEQPLKDFLFKLHAFLNDLPSVEPQHPLHAARALLKRGVAVSYPQPVPTEDTKSKVAFEKPSDIALVGSWPDHLSVKSKDGAKYQVDLAVEMPAQLLQAKDYMNGRFFHQKAFYLAVIADAIERSKDIDVTLSYHSSNNDPRLTTLVLDPIKGSKSDFSKSGAQIRIIPVLPSNSCIPQHRLSPSHSNIRLHPRSNGGSHDDSPEYRDSMSAPTPLYNTALLTSLIPKRRLLATHAIKEETEAFSDALALLRVWANQRGYGVGTRPCVHGFEHKGAWWSALLEYLVFGNEHAALSKQPSSYKASKRKPLGRGLSSYQMFRAALDFLANHDFSEEPVFVKTVNGHKFAPAEYEEAFSATFVESSSLVNLLADVPLGSLDLLRYDAQVTLESLNKTSSPEDQFAEAFLKDQRDLASRFDTVLRVDLTSAKPRKQSPHDILEYGSYSLALIISLANLLRKAFGGRAKAIALLHPTSTTRPISRALPYITDIVFIGIIHHPDFAFQLVDHGPAATDSDTVAAEAFRELWGPKAELRRFKDGRITESVVWEVQTNDERAHVPALISRHILRHHFNVEDEAIVTWQSGFDKLIRAPVAVSRLYAGTTMAIGFKGALTAFNQLVRALRNIDESEVPLAISNISAVSEQLRYTSVFAPLPLPPSVRPALPSGASYLAPIDVNIEFTRSGLWPDDLVAIEKIKLAVFERIASSLTSANSSWTAKVAVGDEEIDSDIADAASLQVVTAEGWAFTLRIMNEREPILLDRIIEEKDGLPHITRRPKHTGNGGDYPKALRAKESYLRRFVHAPKHHRAVLALSQKHTVYAGTVRLVKRWLAAHMLLGGHISEEAVEILCSQFFVEAYGSVRMPSSRERGFAAVIRFLKDWDWEGALDVPLYSSEDLPSETLSVAHTGVWKLITQADKEGWVWTSSGPDAVIARRVRALAQASWVCLERMEQGSLTVSQIFTHPTNDYHFLIRLDPNVLPRYTQNVSFSEPVYSNLRNKEYTLRPGFDPASMLYRDLKRIYSNSCKLFHDPLGGDIIAGIWDPALLSPREFRVLGGFSSMPSETEGKSDKRRAMVALNQRAILSEMKRIGQHLIQSIQHSD
ncbi:Nrap protein [Fistulina hepatica ATCC 64428]|uniref:U3 small nucleolar RNA-associated protein 22 n=1 Tax=Fistulina hepatica ATCC 64428 TaxID=1128425 RepID=A0A0D7AJ09_9AGAR|nr:Nrap protein [Fistulina hepatica ATCC 64428]